MTLTLNLTIPDELSRELSVSFPDPGRVALEALAVKAYERDVFSLEQVRLLLNLPSRWEAQALLSKHGAWPGTTDEDFHSAWRPWKSFEPPPDHHH